MIRIDKELNDVKKDSGYIGKLKANFFSKEFNIYDTGKNPKKTKNPAELRLNLGAILYVNYLFILSFII